MTHVRSVLPPRYLAYSSRARKNWPGSLRGSRSRARGPAEVGCGSRDGPPLPKGCPSVVNTFTAIDMPIGRREAGVGNAAAHAGLRTDSGQEPATGLWPCPLKSDEGERAFSVLRGARNRT